MLDYKSIITKRYVLNLSFREIAEQVGGSKSGVSDFIAAFKRCDRLEYPLPEGITNYAIYEMVYGKPADGGERDASYALPDYAEIHKQMSSRQNMTLLFLWNRYKKQCIKSEEKYYSYRQFCARYAIWCDDNDETARFNAVIGQTIEVDFAGQTFDLISPSSGEITKIVVFVAILPYSQMIYAEGMTSTKEPQWIEVNNNALKYFGGVTPIIICDNCKQAVLANTDWIQPDLNKDYAEWAEHNGTTVLPAKVRRPKYKSHVENAVGILEKGFFHILEERQYFSLEAFNEDLWEELDKLNHEPFKKKDHDRYYYWKEEQEELLELPPEPYVYTERKVAKVSGDCHIRFDNAYYSVDKAFKHKPVMVKATTDRVKIYSMDGHFICEHMRASHRGQWITDPSHLPKDFNGYRDWSADFFIKEAMTVGPNTVAVIKRILASRKYEIQTYRLCRGVLAFAKKYEKQVLEECCRQALSQGHVTYTTIKNTIPVIAEEIGTPEVRSKINEERNRGAFVMNADAMDVDNLLKKSSDLAAKTNHGKKVIK